MREILFRGKRKDNGQWVVGYYVYDESGQTTEKPTAYICHLNTHPCGYSLIPYEVDPETVGEYTGITDENGKMIFEGDFVQIWSNVKEMFDVHDGVINYIGGRFGVGGGNDGFRSPLFSLTDINWEFRGKVIGNIHDNPELLNRMESEDE